MGVRGLFSFAENKFDCFESISLKDTKLIIDGNNLRFFLYKRTKKRKCSFGGEYLLYFNATRDYFNRYVNYYFEDSLFKKIKEFYFQFQPNSS